MDVMDLSTARELVDTWQSLASRCRAKAANERSAPAAVAWWAEAHAYERAADDLLAALLNRRAPTAPGEQLVQLTPLVWQLYADSTLEDIAALPGVVSVVGTRADVFIVTLADHAGAETLEALRRLAGG